MHGPVTFSKQSISADDPVHSVQFSTHGDKLLHTTRSTTTIWDLSKKEKVSTINCDGSFAEFSPRRGLVLCHYIADLCRSGPPKMGYSNPETVIHHSNDILSINFAPNGGKRDGERTYGKFSRRDLDSRSCHSAPDIKEEKTVSKIARLVSHVQ
jgi:WD40 repeat protein